MNLMLDRALRPLPLVLAGLLASQAATAATPVDDAKQDPIAAEMARYEDSIKTPSPISDHFAIIGGVVVGDIHTRGQVNDSVAGISGTTFSAEQDFGLPRRSTQGRAEFMFRLHNRGRLRVSALDVSREGSAFLTQPVRYGTQTFLVTDRVNSTFDWREFDLTWLFSFVRSDRFELGTGLGMHFIQAEATAVAQTRPASRQAFDGSGPFVTLAVDSTWRMTRRFSLNARAQTFEVTASSISAKLFDWHADVQFRWHRNLAAGLGYQSNYVRLDIANRNPSGSIRFAVAGPQLFLRASF